MVWKQQWGCPNPKPLSVIRPYMAPQGLTLATCSQLGLNPQPASHRLSVYVRGPDKMAATPETWAQSVHMTDSNKIPY